MHAVAADVFREQGGVGTGGGVGVGLSHQHNLRAAGGSGRQGGEHEQGLVDRAEAVWHHYHRRGAELGDEVAGVEPDAEWAEQAARRIVAGIFWPPAPEVKYDDLAALAPEGLERALGEEWAKFLAGNSQGKGGDTP